MRILRVVIFVLISIAAILFLYSFVVRRAAVPGSTVLPLDLQKIIPSGWSVVPNQYKNCDFDGDGEDEYLVIYSYDPVTSPSGLPSSIPTPQVITGRSLIGGAIFDTQVNRVPQLPGTTAPYRPAFLVPYKLLPDIYGSKGQGYLGQSSVKYILLPGDITKQQCVGKEIAVYGYNQDNLPTSLSLFRWAGESVGYVDAFFQADTRLQTYGPDRSTEATKPVMEVFTYNQLNQRSLLCSVRHYARKTKPGTDGLPPGLEFEEQPADQTIDFCYGPPKDPAYPEGVVIALLRGQNPDNDTPTGSSYFMPDATMPPKLEELKQSQRMPFRVLSMDVPGALGPNPPQGTSWNPPPGTPSATPQAWWQSSDTAPVNVEIVLKDQTVMQARFTLTSIANAKANTDTHWRITQVDWR